MPAWWAPLTWLARRQMDETDVLIAGAGPGAYTTAPSSEPDPLSR
jgi:hypothetical protein